MTEHPDAGHSAAIPLFDCDSHVVEPPDLWTSRLGREFAEAGLPRVVERGNGYRAWKIGEHILNGEAKYAVAGWNEYPPGHPPNLDQADPAAWDPHRRLERMDQYGVQAQVLYPNLVAFSHWAFETLGPELSVRCIQAWNDFLIDFSCVNPRRLVPIMMLPFWDVDATVKEIKRSAQKGHKGVLLAGSFDRMGLPKLADEHWKPVLDCAADYELSINFHIGVGQVDAEIFNTFSAVPPDEHTSELSVSMLGNAKAIADLICLGVCHRYPTLRFVSVESGVGWLPYLGESLDWHWRAWGVWRDHPDWELPSVYLHRQVLGSFWFEDESVRRVADLIPDNIMFETDFPHPTSLSPGPISPADPPMVVAQRTLSGLPEHLQRKLMFENGARLYHLI